MNTFNLSPIRTYAHPVLRSLIMGALLGMAGCQPEGPAERVGRQVDQAADKVGQQVEKAGERIQDASK